MIPFGIPTLIETKSVAELAALCGELGFSFVELNTNFPQYQLHRLNPEELNHLSKRYGIGYTIHLNDEMPVADFNPTVARGYREAVLEAVSFAKRIGATVLNMHLSEGARYTTPQETVYFNQAYREDYLAGIAAFRDACTAAAGGSGVCICMENTRPWQDVQKEALELLLESPVFGLTLDIGHSHCGGYADEPWLLAHSSRLRHMHIHDAKNSTQDHLPLGTGSLDIPGYLDLAQRCGCTAVLEVKTAAGLYSSAAWLKDAGYR